MDHAGVGRALHAETALGENLEHPVVVAQHVGLELDDSGRPRDAAEMVEQNRADTASLMLVEYGEGDLGARRSRGDIAADADEALVGAGAQRRHQRDVGDEVDFGEAYEVLLAQRTLQSEEAMVDRVLAHVAEVIEQAFLVVGADTADMDRTAIAQDLVRGVISGFETGVVGHDVAVPSLP